MEQTVKERIMELIKFKGLSVRTFESKCGLSNGYLRQLRSSPTVEKLESILCAYPDVNREWLVTGEGEMIKPGFKNEVEDLTEKEAEFIREGLSNGTIEMVPIHREPDKSYRMVPLINIDSVGGIHSENLTAESEQYVMRMMPFTEAREGDVAIFQSGNSMYPTIPSGSILLIREVPDWREYFGYGNIYVLWLRDGRRITKEIRRYDADAQNYVWCVSYNPDVADEELPKSMIRGVWKVIKFQADFGW